LFDENSRPVLTDFGIAKTAGRPYNRDLTPQGKTLGTPAYMSPEQALGKEVTAKTDLYAFGVMMYQMLTGQIPFKANTPTGMMKQHVEAVPPHLPHDLIDFDHIIQRLLHKQAELRYETAWELHSELEKFVM
jgi:serine/threonine protein kinase